MTWFTVDIAQSCFDEAQPAAHSTLPGWQFCQHTVIAVIISSALIVAHSCLKLSVTFAVIDERIRIGITPLIALATGVGHRYILIFWVNLTISAHIIIFVRTIAGFCV